MGVFRADAKIVNVRRPEWSVDGNSPPGETRPAGGDHRDVLDRVRRRVAGEGVELVDAVEGARVVRLIDRICLGPMAESEALVRWREEAGWPTPEGHAG